MYIYGIHTIENIDRLKNVLITFSLTIALTWSGIFHSIIQTNKSIQTYDVIDLSSISLKNTKSVEMVQGNHKAI